MVEYGVQENRFPAEILPGEDARRSGQRGTRMRKVINTILIILFLSLGASTAILTYYHFFAEVDDDLSGEWITKLDMTQYAATSALSWLQDIEAVSVSLQAMEAYMQGLEIHMNLTMEQTDRSVGTFQCNIAPESYDACNQAAYEAFTMAFRDALAERLRMAGYTDGMDEDSMDEEAIEALVTETFGMSTVSYLMACGPVLLPPLEELQAGYDGSGTYETVEGVLIRQFNDELPVAAKREHYILTEVHLILSEEIDSASSNSFFDRYPIVYTSKRHEWKRPVLFLEKEREGRTDEK